MVSKYDHGRQAQDLKERLLASIDTTTGCWLWTKSIRPDGYVEIRIGSRRDGTRKSIKLHRIAYEVFIGPIPLGFEIDHLCGVRHCINPSHLEAVTPRVNTLRSTNPSAINARKQVCPKCNGDYRKYSYARRCLACERKRYHLKKAERCSDEP